MKLHNHNLLNCVFCFVHCALQLLPPLHLHGTVLHHYMTVQHPHPTPCTGVHCTVHYHIWVGRLVSGFGLCFFKIMWTMCREWMIQHWKLYISVSLSLWWSLQCAAFSVQCAVCSVQCITCARGAHGATFGLALVDRPTQLIYVGFLFVDIFVNIQVRKT